LTRWALTRTVPAPVVRHDAARPGERTNDGIPAVMVTPGAMDQNERLAGPVQLAEQLDTIHADDGQRNPLRQSDRFRDNCIQTRVTKA
jgi:hypothetical protein